MMSTNRLEAFSDGVIAVIITIMVLELKVPSDTTLTSLRSLVPQFLTYLLSFLVVAIMWVNHHHLLHSARGADARLLGLCQGGWHSGSDPGRRDLRRARAGRERK